MSTYRDFSDPELLSLLRGEDHAAFNEIYRRYWRTLYRTADFLLRNEQAADDVIQEIFVWLWANRAQHLTNNLQPYLRAAVKYQVANVIRRGKLQETFFARTVATFQPAEENTYELQELKEIIAAFAESLPEKARVIFKMSREDLLTNKEIARELNISEKTVENQMTINLKKLRLQLGKLHFWSILL